MALSSRVKRNTVKRILKITDNKCARCGKQLKVSNATLEHIFPIRAGGRNDWYNLTVLCDKCNHDKLGNIISNVGRYYKYIPKVYVGQYQDCLDKNIELYRKVTKGD